MQSKKQNSLKHSICLYLIIHRRHYILCVVCINENKNIYVPFQIQQFETVDSDVNQIFIDITQQ